MRVITCVEDLHLLARRRVPRMFYDYVDSGSWTESTYRANERDLAAICFRQRVAVKIENRSTWSTMIGEDVAMPVALAPTGLCGNTPTARSLRPAPPRPSGYRFVCRP